MAFEVNGSKTTFNFENVLYKNITENSLYYENQVSNQLDFDQTVDEIYEKVDHLEPWLSGNARGPSTAFCLVYHLCAMGITAKQIKILINHEDSPYIRAVGLLVLRYICDPKQLWSWYEPHLLDPEPVTPSPGGREVSLGEYLRDIMLVQNYFETIFPRIPEPIRRDWIKRLEEMGLPGKGLGNGGLGGADRRGGDEPNRRPASVKASMSVAFGQRAPNRRNAVERADHRPPSDRRFCRDWEEGEEARGGGGGGARSDRPRGMDRYDPRPRSRSPVRERERERDRGYDRERERERRRSRSRSRDRDPPRRPSRSRSRERGEIRPPKPRDWDLYDKYDKPRGGRERSRSREGDRDRRRDYGGYDRDRR